MAVDTPSISRPATPAPSLDYEQLFLEGIRHIEQLSGKIWTDYNAHDPGITILEVLTYAITELGYRCDFAIGDIIEPAPGSTILNDFFSLANVGSNAPLTIDDFRKLLIDMEAVRNAWLEKVVYPDYDASVQPPPTDPHARLFLHTTGPNAGFLDNSATPTPAKQIKVKGLYDVYLQFEEHPEYGDLNDNSLKTTLYIQPIGQDGDRPFVIEFEFPEWENIPGEADLLSDLLAGPLPTSGYFFEIVVDGLTPVQGEEFVYELSLNIGFVDHSSATHSWSLMMFVRVISGQEYVLNRSEFRNKLEIALNNHSYDGTPTTEPIVVLILDFLGRREVIKTLLEASRISLANHRNLCEDFRAVHPMSLQEIGLDLNLDIAPDADCVAIMAQVYHRTAQYLSPVIRLYSLREMLERGYTPEEIFRGPWLLNGFIDENDLSFYLRREILYTSDLVQEFMKIEGVRAVNHIAFSRYEQGRLALRGTEPQKNLTECLCLINPARYLPRLNVDRSTILMNCGGGKPSQPDKVAALKLLSEFKAADDLKGKATQGDFEIPQGTYSHLGDYHSIQEDFPLTYGIGTEGLSPSEPPLRLAQAQQLKGYLLFFEQLLGNFLAQVHHLGKLFSYSDDIDRTYFTQALYQVPRVDALIRDFTQNHQSSTFDFEDYQGIQDPNSDYYALKLDALAESNPVFQDRRKRFLDHLVARFNESFSEYAAYVWGRGLSKAAQHGILIQDQARFLRHYVLHSHDRGTGFNYQRVLELSDTPSLIPHWYWRAGLDIESINTESGGIELLPLQPRTPVDEEEEFDIYQDASGNYRFRLYNANGVNMLYSTTSYSSEGAVKAAIETAVADGQIIGNYTIGTTTTLGSYARVGAAFINTYDGDAAAAVEALMAYLAQLATVDELPEEGAQGHVLWQGINDVTGIKKRMTFLTGLPNVNRQYTNPFHRFQLTGTVPSLGFELMGDEGDVIAAAPSGTVFATEDAALHHILQYFFEYDGPLFLEADTLGQELRTVSGDPDSTFGVVEPTYEPLITDLEERLAALRAYLHGLYHIENLHVVEHILLRQRMEDDPTLEVRIDEGCPALDIEDPYSFRISVVLPKWAGRFREQSFRTMFKRLMRAEVPAHVYIHFFWIDPLQMYQFERCWAAWLAGGWQTPAIGGGIAPGDDSLIMPDCLNALRNLLDAHYVVEPPRIKDEYADCEIIAAPYDPDGDIIKAFLAPGFELPPGLCMDPCSGAIRVIDYLLLDDTLNSIPLEIITINAGGEETWHTVTINFAPNGRIRIDTVIEERYLCAYLQGPNNGETLVTFVDTDLGGQVIEAILLGWTRWEDASMTTVLSSNPPSIFPTGIPMPPGMDMDENTGEITVSNYLAILPGYYRFEVQLQDNSGGYSILHPIVSILPDREAVATLTPPLNEDAYVAGDILATITDADGDLASVLVASGHPSLASMGLALSPSTFPAAWVNIVVDSASDFHTWLTNPTSPVTVSGGYYHFTLHLATEDHCLGETALDIPIQVIQDHEATFVQVPTTVMNVSLYQVGTLAGKIQDILDGGLVAYKLVENNALLNPLGLGMSLNSLVEPPQGEIKVTNRIAFISAINAASPSQSVGTLTVPLETKDATGGLSVVTAIIQARKDALPIVTVEPAQNVDVYVQGDVLVTIEDMDSAGIVSATHVASGHSLAALGMALRLRGGYGENANAAHAGSNFRTSNLPHEYQSLPAPLYYQEPQPGYAEIVVQNLGLFRQGVATHPAYVVVDPLTHRVRLTLTVNTTDAQGGFATNVVEIDILQDVEAVMTDLMNGERIHLLATGSIMVRFQNLDTNTAFESISIVPPLTKEFQVVAGTDRYDIVVANAQYLAPRDVLVTVTITDDEQGQTVFPVTLSVRPRLVMVNYTVAATQQGHVLNLGAKVPGLKMLTLLPAYLPKAFGTISIGNGTQVGFVEGSSYASSTYPMSTGFIGVITSTNETVEGVLTITRQQQSPSTTTSSQRLGALEENSLVHSATTQGNAHMRWLATETGSLIAELNAATFFPDNPALRTSPEVLEAYATGEMDVEVAARFANLAQETAGAILQVQDTVRTAQGASKRTASAQLEVYAEILRLQLMGAIHFAANVRQDDLEGATAIQSLFTAYQQLLYSIFDGQVSSAHFPEWGALRRTLREEQDLYTDSKPLLAAAVEGLLPTAPYAQLGGIEAKLPAPSTGAIHAEVATLLGRIRNAFAAVDQLFAQPEFRKDWVEGNPASVEDVFENFLDPNLVQELASYLQATHALLQELPYGIQQLELQHAYARAAELLVTTMNGLFELLDHLPGEIESGLVLPALMDQLAGTFTSISAQSGLGEFRNLIANWASKWPLKPGLSTPVEGWLEVATLDMQPPFVIDRYAAGDTIASVRMRAGNLASVQVAKGKLPRGLRLTGDGKILVDDPALLLEGIFGDIELAGTNDRGFSFTLTVPDIEFSYDNEATYVVLPPVTLAEYQDKMVLAFPKDVDGALVMAQVQTGKIPPGIRFNTETGEFTVARVGKLVAGTYALTVTTVDPKGGHTLHDIELKIGAEGGTADAIPVSVKLMAILPVTQGDRIGTLMVDGIGVVDAQVIRGSVPAGLAMDIFGTFSVTNPKLVVLQSSYLEVLAVGTNGIKYLFQLIIDIVSGGIILPEAYATVTVNFSEVLPVAIGTEIADLAPPYAPLIAAESYYVPFPDGIAINSEGVLYVTDPTELVGGNHAFMVRTEDDLGELTVYRVYLRLIDLSIYEPVPDRLVVTFLDIELPLASGHLIGVVTASGVALSSINVLGGDLPKGIAMTGDGKLVVTQPSLLYLGRFAYLIEAQAVDGHTYQIEVQIGLTGTGPIPGTRDALYIEFLDLQLPLEESATLGTIAFEGLTLTLLQWVEGTMPAGLLLESTGAIQVSEAGVQEAGNFNFQVRDMSAALSSIPIFVRLAFLAVPPISLELTLTEVELPVFIGDELGAITASGVELDSVHLVSGDLPTHTSLQADGTLVATAGQDRTPDTFVFVVAGHGTDGNDYEIEVTLEYVDHVASEPLALEFRGIELPVSMGTVIGTVAGAGVAMVKSEVGAGNLPPGLALYNDGKIQADAPELMEAGVTELVVVALGNDGTTYTASVLIELLSDG